MALIFYENSKNMHPLQYLLKPFMRVSLKNVEMEVRGFDCPDPTLKKHLETVGRSFLKGYHDVLNGQEENYNQTLDPMYCGFAFEGAGMASLLLDAFTGQGIRSAQALLKKYPEHKYIIHVGIGWALARIPWANVEKQANRFDPLLKDLILDGYGFHQAYFKTKQAVYQAKLPKGFSPEGLHVYHQGIGRACWFVFGGQPKKIFSAFQKFAPQYQGDLWAGIGLAMAYAGGVSAEVLMELQDLAKAFEAELAQGITFAAKTRLLANNMMPHTILAAEIFTGKDVETIAQIADEEAIKLGDFNLLERPYQTWRKNIMKNLQTQYSHEQ